jgi:hypothetical protein
VVGEEEEEEEKNNIVWKVWVWKHLQGELEDEAEFVGAIVL